MAKPTWIQQVSVKYLTRISYLIRKIIYQINNIHTWAARIKESAADDNVAVDNYVISCNQLNNLLLVILSITEATLVFIIYSKWKILEGRWKLTINKEAKMSIFLLHLSNLTRSKLYTSIVVDYLIVLEYNSQTNLTSGLTDALVHENKKRTCESFYFLLDNIILFITLTFGVYQFCWIKRICRLARAFLTIVIFLYPAISRGLFFRFFVFKSPQTKADIGTQACFWDEQHGQQTRRTQAFRYYIRSIWTFTTQIQSNRR